jgi:hypothetical protein
MLASEYTLDYDNNNDDYNICESDESLGQIKYLDHASSNFVKYVAAFNCGKIVKNINDVLIEYYFERPASNMVRSTKNKTPIISSMTFLNGDPNIMAVFTDLTNDIYKYKKYRNYKNEKKIFVSILEKNKHIIHNGENCSLFINRDSSNAPIALFMNVYGVGNCGKSEQHFFANEAKYSKVEISNRLNFDFYENMLYQKKNDCLKFIWIILDDGAKSIEFIDMFNINAYLTNSSNATSTEWYFF